MTDNVEECREKFRKILDIIRPQKVVSDDTFLEKIQSYLTNDGKNLLSYQSTDQFHNNTSFSSQNTTTYLKMRQHSPGSNK